MGSADSSALHLPKTRPELPTTYNQHVDAHYGATELLGSHQGTRYVLPIAIARILLDYTQDQDTMVAASLHDTVEDTSLSLGQVAPSFNPVVKRIVDGVTRLDSCLQSFKRIQLSTHENIRKLMEVKDKRVLYVKLADRLHNMRTITVHPALAKQKRIAEETLRFFVPVAKSIVLKPIAEELQEWSFAVLNCR